MSLDIDVKSLPVALTLDTLRKDVEVAVRDRHGYVMHRGVVGAIHTDGPPTVELYCPTTGRTTMLHASEMGLMADPKVQRRTFPYQPLRHRHDYARSIAQMSRA